MEPTAMPATTAVRKSVTRRAPSVICVPRSAQHTKRLVDVLGWASWHVRGRASSQRGKGKSMRRQARLALGAVLGVSALLVAACGSDNSGGSAATTAGGATTTAASGGATTTAASGGATTTASGGGGTTTSGSSK